MRFENDWEMFTSSEKETFQKACRRLLKSTFIVKEKDDDNRKLYIFVSKNEDTFSEYLGYMGFDILIDKDNGVVMLVNDGNATDSGRIQANRLRLKKSETIVLCCLWTIYVDRIRRGNLSKGIVITILDLRQELEKYGFRDDFEGKTMMNEILKLFSRYCIVDISGKIGEPDCKIKIYPSIQFALNTEEFKNLVEETEKKIKSAKSAQDEEDYEGEDSDYEE